MYLGSCGDKAYYIIKRNNWNLGNTGERLGLITSLECIGEGQSQLDDEGTLLLAWEAGQHELYH